MWSDSPELVRRRCENEEPPVEHIDDFKLLRPRIAVGLGGGERTFGCDFEPLLPWSELAVALRRRPNSSRYS